MKRILVLWLAAALVAAQPCYAAVCVGFGQSASEYTTIVDQTTNDQTVQFSAAEIGTGFTLPVSATDIRVTVQLTGVSGTCEMRLDDDTTMSAEYIASTTFEASSGSNTAVISGTFTSGGRYIIVRCPNGSIYRASSNVSAAVEYRYGSFNSWAVGEIATRDLTIKLEYK